MFGFLKKKKKDKGQALDLNSIPEENEEKPQKDDIFEDKNSKTDKEEQLSEKELAKRKKLKNLQGKISRILQSNNIEIVDENLGDEFESEEINKDSDKQKQQDYDSLKAIFGKSDKNKSKQEVTLTIDDFDFTYTGKYVDELDLIHMKNIRRIRLPSKYKKLIKKLVVAATVLVVIIVGVIVGINLTKEQPVYLKSVSLSQTSQTYFKDDVFDYTGIYIIANFSDGRVVKEKLSSKYYFSKMGPIDDTLKFYNKTIGVNGAKLVFLYMNTPLDIFVDVIEKDECGISAKYTEGIFDLKKDEFITKEYFIAMVDYTNYNSIKLEFNNIALSISVDGQKLEYDKNNLGFKVKNDITSSSNITISYNGAKGNFNLQLQYGQYSVSTVT